MGLVGAIVGTLALGYLNGKAQQDQYNAMAAQADANRRIEENNARKADEAAKEQDRVNKINEENQRRKNLLLLGEQKASIGASGITATGSALNALADSYTNMNMDAGMASYNNRQKTQQLFEESTGHTQQAIAYGNQASSYRDAADSAMTNSLLGSVFSAVTPLAGGLYGSNSAAKVSGTSSASSAGSGFGGVNSMMKPASMMGSWSKTSIPKMGSWERPY